MNAPPIDWTTPVNLRRLELFRTLLAAFQPGRLVDLGSGHGRFAQEAVIRGWDATAVDARTERWATDSTVIWIEADVREFDVSGYDLICCLGLFYHLTLSDQLDLVKRCAGRPMIIDTHLDTGKSRFPLSERIVVEGYEGRLFDEENGLLSSWRNPQSFWPTPDSFRRMLAEQGFVVLEAHPPIDVDRSFHLALPRPA